MGEFMTRPVVFAALLSLAPSAHAAHFQPRVPAITILSAQIVLGIGAVLALMLLAMLVFRKRPGRRFSFSLRWLMAFTLACSVMVWGGTRWHFARIQLADYNADVAFKRKIDRLVSFEFVDTPMEDGLKFLHSLTKLDFSIDPELQKRGGEPQPINFRVQDMRLENALQWMAVCAEIDCQIQSGKIAFVPRSEPSIQAGTPPTPNEAAEIEAMRAKLTPKVSFEFVDTPLADAVDFFRHLANVTMIVDPKIFKTAPPGVSLRVTDEKLESAMRHVMRLTKCDFEIRDQAIFIHKRLAPAELTAENPAEAAALKVKLQRNVSFEFVDTPLEDALKFLNSLTKASIVVEPDVDMKTAVNLRVQNVRLESALDRILKITHNDRVFADEAIVIFKSPPERPAGGLNQEPRP